MHKTHNQYLYYASKSRFRSLFDNFDGIKFITYLHYSCGQVQAGDIGLMGIKAKKNGEVVEGVNLFTGGKVGKGAKLGTVQQKSIPCDDLKPILRELLINEFGATLR